MKEIAKLLSTVCIPLLMPIYALILAMYLPQDIDFNTFKDNLFLLDPKAKKYFLMVFAAISFVFPAISILIMRWTKVINTIDMDDKNERYLPYVLIGVYGIGLSYLLINVNKTVAISPHLIALAVGCTIISFINLFVNTQIKTSAHATGIGIFLGFLLAYFASQPILFIYPLLLCILIGAAVISARIILNKHTDKELLVGFTTGFFVIIVADLLFINRII